MEDIFKKLCKIAAGIESDQNRLIAKVTFFLEGRHYLMRSTNKNCRKKKKKNTEGKGNLKRKEKQRRKRFLRLSMNVKSQMSIPEE